MRGDAYSFELHKRYTRLLTVARKEDSDMNDLPTEQSNGTTEDKPPLLATIEAMQRLKEKNTELETRVGNLEKAFEMAFKNGAASLQEFLTNLDAKDGSSDEEGNEAEITGETVKDEEESEEENSDRLPD